MGWWVWSGRFQQRKRRSKRPKAGTVWKDRTPGETCEREGSEAGCSAAAGGVGVGAQGTLEVFEPEGPCLSYSLASTRWCPLPSCFYGLTLATHCWHSLSEVLASPLL